MVRLGVTRVLQAADIRVVGEAATRVEGIRLVRAEQAQLVLFGDHLGTDALEALREVKAMASPPLVIVLVGQAVRADLVDLTSAGADGVLARSVGPDELTEAVGRVLAGERVVSPAFLPLVIGTVLAADDGGFRAGPVPAPSGEGALTAKEREVLVWLADGRSNHEIAEALFVTPATVKTHLAHIYTKLDVKSRHQALARAVALGYLQ
jgi:DNA-binding NarL/FixJ family response regulator